MEAMTQRRPVDGMLALGGAHGREVAVGEQDLIRLALMVGIVLERLTAVEAAASGGHRKTAS